MSFELVGVRLVAEGGPEYFGTMAKADKAVTDFGTTNSQTFKQMPGLADLAVGAFHRVGAMAVDAFAQAGRAAVSFIGDSISAAGDFEAGMNQFAAVAGGALDESGLKLKDFSTLFLDLGKELPVSTAEVQQAATEMIKGGIDPATVAAGGLKQNIQFAAAAMGGDLAAAATVSAKILGGWAEQGATAEEKATLLTSATDLLTKAANASTVDVDELALGLYNVQGTAKTTGLSLEETTTALAELAPRFASSSEAGTSFKNFLIRLQPTTKPAIAAMKGLGLYTDEAGSAFFDANGEFIGVAKASELLKDKLGGLNDAQRTQALQTIFGNDAMNAAAAFAEMGADGYTAMAESLAKANGVQANAATMQQGYNVALDNFHGSIEALQITIATAFLPLLTDLFNNVLSPAINTLSTLSGVLSGDQEAFDKLSPPIQDIVLWIGELMSGSGGLTNIWQNTLLPAATAVGEYFLGTIYPILSDLATALFPLVNAAIDVAAGFWTDVLWPALNTFWSLLNATVIPILGDLARWLAENLPGAIATARDFLTGTLFPAMHDVYDFIDTSVIPIFADVTTWLRENVPAGIKVAADYWNDTLWPALNKVWGFIQDNIVPIFATVVTWLRDNIPTAVQKVADFWNNTLWPALDKTWSFINKNVIPIFDALVNVWWALMKKEIQILADLWTDTLAPAIEIVYDWFNDNIVPILEDANTGMGVVSDAINKTLGPAFTWLGDNVLSPAVDWFNDIGTAISGVVDWLNDLAEKINNLPSLPDPFVGHSPPPIAQWMDAIAGGAELATGAIFEIGGAIANLPRSLPSWMDDISSGLSLGGGGGGSMFGGGLSHGISSPSALAMRGAGMSSAVYNQQRTTNLTYHTTHAPPASQSLALASALAGGS